MGTIKDQLKRLGLTKRQITFCLFYLKNFNATKAALLSGMADKSESERVGAELLMEDKIKQGIEILRGNKKHAQMTDIMDMYSRIAYADCRDFIVTSKNEKGEWVSEIDPQKIDGQIVEEVTALKDGIKVKFYDKIKALEKMEKILACSEQQKTEENKNSITVLTSVQRSLLPGGAEKEQQIRMQQVQSERTDGE